MVDFGCIDVPLSVLLLVAVVSLLYIFGKWRLKFLSSHGIRGPKPTIFVGNTLEMQKMGFLPTVDIWIKKYGNVFGMYFGIYPIIYVLDLDILKEVFVKNFQNFTDRRDFGILQYPVHTGLFFAKGKTWKRIRNIITPTFSAGKLKLLCNRIKECSATLEKNFVASARKHEIVNMKDYFGAYTMDVIASTAFGIEVDSQNDFNNLFVTNAREAFGISFLENPAYLISSIIPQTAPLLKALGFGVWAQDSVDFFIKTIRELIEQRKQDASCEKNRQLDFLQLLLNAELQEQEGEFDQQNGYHSDQIKLHKKLSTDEILGQAFLFFVAGYETTASTLNFVSHALATNPDVQDKLVEEINRELRNDEPNYDNISKLKYLECVINETLRLYPPLTAIDRKVEETVTIKGVTIPKGAGIVIPIYHIHRTPEYYPEPEMFKPERFLNKVDINPVAFLPFGYGPRLCIGMRLAMVEVKIALICVLRKVKFVKLEDTPAKIEFKSDAMLKPETPVTLRVEPRQMTS